MYKNDQRNSGGTGEDNKEKKKKEKKEKKKKKEKIEKKEKKERIISHKLCIKAEMLKMSKSSTLSLQELLSKLIIMNIHIFFYIAIVK